ncbi:hypothetical protein Golax_008068, partial [Gossypium laxum]|nr:hypothetical protein [Gossypium laxum]
MEATSIESTESGVTTGLRPWKGQSNWRHQHHLKNVHGILNIFGWGLLLPIGAIVARNFSKFPLKCDDWYQLHTLCQTSGYIVGAVGWGTGIWLGNSSRQYTLKAHRILGIIVFTLATLQMLAMWLQAKKEDECGKWWEICYNVLGYVVIVLSIANIFEGIGNIRSHAAEYWSVTINHIVATCLCFYLLVTVEHFPCLRARLLDRVGGSFGRKPGEYLCRGLSFEIMVLRYVIAAKSGVEPSGLVELAKHHRRTSFPFVYNTSRTLANCRYEVCNALATPEKQYEVSIQMSGDCEQAGRIIF